MTFHVFGYGSLVNAGTHDYAALHLAKLPGWKRAWRHTNHRQVAFLTIVPSTDAAIWGAVAPVPAGSWQELDQREWAYARHDVSEVVDSSLSEVSIAAYAIPEDEHFSPTPDHPILQSYVDTVLAGYDALLGTEGVAHFIATTDGWDAPFLQDRAAPRYPRAQSISATDLARYDAALDDVGILRI